MEVELLPDINKYMFVYDACFSIVLETHNLVECVAIWAD